jgi:hypothetical protein
MSATWPDPADHQRATPADCLNGSFDSARLFVMRLVCYYGVRYSVFGATIRRRQMDKDNKAGATRPCPHSHEVSRAAAKKTSPKKKQAAVKARAKAAPTDLAGQPEADTTILEEDDWISRQLPTYD